MFSIASSKHEGELGEFETVMQPETQSRKHRVLKFLWNIFLEQLNRPLQLSQINVTSRALASFGLSAYVNGYTRKCNSEAISNPGSLSSSLVVELAAMMVFSMTSPNQNQNPENLSDKIILEYTL